MLPVIERVLVVHFGTPRRAPALTAVSLVALHFGVWLGTYGHLVASEMLLMTSIMICLSSLGINFVASFFAQSRLTSPAAGPAGWPPQPPFVPRRPSLHSKERSMYPALDPMPTPDDPMAFEPEYVRIRRNLTGEGYTIRRLRDARTRRIVEQVAQTCGGALGLSPALAYARKTCEVGHHPYLYADADVPETQLRA